jgi:DNA-binding NtrC family response regulator
MKSDRAPEDLLLLLAAELSLPRAVVILEAERELQAKTLAASRAELSDAGASLRADAGGRRVAGLEQIGRAIVELPGGGDKLRLAEKAAVRYALEVAKGNKSAAARLLGVERKAVERRASRFGSARTRS